MKKFSDRIRQTFYDLKGVDIDSVEAYASKKNHKSQSILKYLGLSEAGVNKNGNSYYYKGNYKYLYDLFNNSLQEL